MWLNWDKRVGNYYENMESSIIETSNKEEKVSPNAILVIRKHYNDCGHTVEDEAIIPEEIVNKTKKELEEMYANWEIRDFSFDKVVLYKELDGICKEHYVLRELDDKVAIYVIDEKGEEKLQEITSISTQYLPKEDLKKLENGIKAIGKEALNSVLEDYE